MKEIIIANKQAYLNTNYPFTATQKLTEKKRCIHCGNSITVGAFKVFKASDGFEFICCPGAPACDGTLIDWIDVD